MDTDEVDVGSPAALYQVVLEPQVRVSGQGVALLLVVLECSRRQPELPRRLAAAALAGAACVALVNLSAVAGRVASSSVPLEEVVWYLGGVGRPSGHVTDLNAAGSYFLLMALTGIGLTFAGGRRLAYAGAPLSLAAGASFWLAGSRTAVAAALIVCAGALTWRCRKPKSTRRRRIVLGAAGAGGRGPPHRRAVGLPGAGRPRRRAHERSHPRRFRRDEPEDVGHRPAVRGRRRTLLRHVRAFHGPVHPGPRARECAQQFPPDRRGARAGRLSWLPGASDRGRATGARRAAVPRQPSGAVARRRERRCRRVPRDVPRGASPADARDGLSVLDHDRCGRGARAAAVRPRPTVSLRRCVATGVAISLFFVGTADPRVDAAVRDAAARRDARSGAFAWEIEPGAGRRFRWIGPRAAFFIPGSEEVVPLPLRAPHASRGRPVTVDVAVGGKHIARIPLFHGDWVELPLRLPVSGGWYGIHRVELGVDPPWPPEERQNGDGRTLGIMVGKVASRSDGAALPRQNSV